MATHLRLIVFNTDAATVAARRLGLFEKEQVEVEVTPTPNSTQQMRGLGAGSWEIASTAFDNVLGWSGREGAEIIALAQAASGILLPVYARPEIRAWADLRGRALAVDAVDTAYALVLRRILLSQGLDLKRGDYELVPVGATGHRLDSMRRGETFAAILNPPWNREAEAAGMARLADHRQVLPDYPGGVIAASRRWAEEHRQELSRFLRAWAAGGKWARQPANREQAVEWIAADEKLGREAAVGRLANLPPSPELNLPGLQCVLDLRAQFASEPKLGRELSRYYDLGYLRQSLEGTQP